MQGQGWEQGDGLGDHIDKGSRKTSLVSWRGHEMEAGAVSESKASGIQELYGRYNHEDLLTQCQAEKEKVRMTPGG